jgi:hypothetical protein
MKYKQKIKIGIVGEHPQNDSEAFLHLLSPKCCEGIELMPIVKNMRGSQLDGAKFLKQLSKEFLNEKLEKVIFVRDADEIMSDEILENKHKRDKWFKEANAQIENKGLFFLAIYEMEALILADIDNFNKLYKIKNKFVSHPMNVSDPKAELKRLSDKSQRSAYEERDAPKIFAILDFQTVYKNHRGKRSFQEFADLLKKEGIIAF